MYKEGRWHVKYGTILGIAAVLAGSAVAQTVISAKSGLIHYTEGTVTLAGKPAAPTITDFPEMKAGEELRTELGRAEVLLSPGVFLRVAENSAVRMISNRLEDTKIELLSGSALLEVGDLNTKEQQLEVLVAGTTVEFTKRGLFRLDASPAQLLVYDGSAVVMAGSQPVTVKEGKQTVLSATASPEKFNKEKGDAFHRWASRRSGYIALANISAAKRMSDNQSTCSAACWMFNPYFGSFTFIPMSGMYRSPFGWSYYSPYTVDRVYYRPPVQTYNPGYGGGLADRSGFGSRSYGDSGSRSSMGTYSSGGASAAPPPPAPAAVAPAGGARSGDSGGGRSTPGGR